VTQHVSKCVVEQLDGIRIVVLGFMLDAGIGAMRAGLAFNAINLILVSLRAVAIIRR
jgi:hypothetical protein